MVQDAHMKLIPGLPRQRQHSTRRKIFTSRLVSKVKEETGEMLHLELDCLWG